MLIWLVISMNDWSQWYFFYIFLHILRKTTIIAYCSCQHEICSVYGIFPGEFPGYYNYHCTATKYVVGASIVFVVHTSTIIFGMFECRKLRCVYCRTQNSSNTFRIFFLNLFKCFPNQRVSLATLLYFVSYLFSG